MKFPGRPPLVPLLLAALLSSLASTGAFADPPDRVARLSYESGTVSFEPAGTEDWVQATLNRPLITGDSLWVDAASRAELNMGRAALRADSQTSVQVTNLDDQVAQFQLAQGTIILHVRSVPPNGVYEIDTPNLALSMSQPGTYRVTVTPDGQTTYALVRQGQATASGDNQSYEIDAGESYAFSGSDLSNYTYYDPPAFDDLDRFSAERDNRWERSASVRYVSPDMIGYEDLDANGTWQPVEGYGNVWVPNNVPVGWAPYQAGHWAWVAPWGWTWVDDAPWGFAPFHYGRWAQIGPGWGWIPGPVAVAPVYAPALVAFVGGPGFAVGIGGGAAVAWFPLGPREVYRPAYEVSPGYVQRINVSNTTVTNTYVTNVYQNTTTVTYVNQNVPHAVTAVPSATFASGRPVAGAAIAVSPSALAGARVTAFAAVAPTARALAGPAAVSPYHPPAAVMQRTVVARIAPPPAPVPFAAKAQALAAQPGRPLPAAAEAQIRSTQPPNALRASAHVIATPARAVALPPPSRTEGAAPFRPGATPPARSTPVQNNIARPPTGIARPETGVTSAEPVARPENLPRPEPVLRTPTPMPAPVPAAVARPEALPARPEIARPAVPAQAHPPAKEEHKDERKDEPR